LTCFPPPGNDEGCNLDNFYNTIIAQILVAKPIHFTNQLIIPHYPPVLLCDELREYPDGSVSGIAKVPANQHVPSAFAG
jgi:hypothetical protein